MGAGGSEAALAGLELPDGYVIPESYELDSSGVWRLTERNSGPSRSRVTWAPLLPKRMFVDPLGSQLVELAWRDGGRWVHRTVARKDVSSGRRLVAALGDDGLPVTEADAKGAERWIAECLAVNHGVIERAPLLRQLGWQQDGTFAAAADSPHRVIPRYEEQAAALAAHHPAGTLGDWQVAIKPMEPYPAAQMALFAGLAAPLLGPLGLDSFTIDFHGRSTRGKTTAAMTGLSPWADPSEKGDGLFSWRTTPIAVEKRLNLANGLPVVIDETRVAKTPEIVDQVIYQVPKNHGQGRGGGWPNMVPWRTIVISTGEQPAVSFTTHQGASARVLGVQAPPFGTSGQDSADAAIQVRDGIARCYGTAGPEFARHLAALLAGDGGQDELVTRHRRLAERFRGDTDISARRAPLVACLALAAHLAYEWGIVPFAPPPDRAWRDLFTTDDPRDNRPEMAVEIAREYVASHQRELWSPHATDESQPPGGWIGRTCTIGGKATVALLPERLREALRRSGYELDAVLPGWLEQGVLHRSDAYKPAYSITRRLAGRKCRMYIFQPGIIADSEISPDDED